MFAIIEVSCYVLFPSAFFLNTLHMQMCITAWITAKYNSHHNFPNSGLRARIRYLLFVSVWTILLSSAFLALFITMADNMLVSLASHALLYGLFYLSPFDHLY